MRLSLARCFLPAILAFPGHAAVPAADSPPVGQVADLAEFGKLKAWPGDEEGKAIARKAGPPWLAMAEATSPRTYNIGVEWDEPREFSEVRFTVREARASDAIRLEYWVSAWPAANSGGWTQTDTTWKGQWRAVQTEARNDRGTWILRLPPLTVDENPNAKNQPGYAPRFRRALKLRLRFSVPKAPELTKLQVFGPSRWNIREVQIQTGCGGSSPAPVSVSAYNGRVLNSEGSANAMRIQLLYLEHAPGSNDRTILSLGIPDLAFGVSVDDLIRQKGIYVRDAGVFVADGASCETFESYLAAGRLREGFDILSQVARHEEQSLEQAMGEIPALSKTERAASHRTRYIPVGLFANRQKYGVEFNGNAFVSKHGSKLFQEEVAEMAWTGDEIAFRVGTGSVPDFREREHSARQRVLEGYQPVVQTEWSQQGIEYEEEAFATLAGAPLDFWRIRGDETSALLMKLTVRNATSTGKHVSIWLDVAPHEKLELRDGALMAIGDSGGRYPAPRLRALLASPAGRFEVTALPPESGSAEPAAHWQSDLGAGDSVNLQFTFTFRTLVKEDEIKRVSDLDYAAERKRVTEFWEAVTNQGMRLHVPDEILNRFYRAVLQHLLVSVYRDVPTGLYIDPCGTLDYNIFANETDMQVRLLDMRGLPEMAAKFLEPLIALQGSKPFPGRFKDGTAILHGVRIDANHDYTHSGYNLNHGWTLWTMAEHYLFTRDEQWLQARVSNLKRAADWIISERKATMQQDENGEKVWEYGLLPAGQLEDNEEWQYWFAVNAYAYRGLRAAADALAAVDSGEAARLKQEAEAYRLDIRRAVFRSMASSPVAPLRDGTWVPAIGSRTHTHGRDYGWIRNILYGPQVLMDGGVFSPTERAATWILKDLEDNLFMSPESFSVAEQDWFSRGGITLQPNLVNTAVTYLERDETPAALRAFYNAFAVSYYPDVNAFTEWAPSFGRSGGPFYKTSDESGSLAWLRLMLVREGDSKLYLASGAPRRWYRHGEVIEVQDAPTYFGQVGFRIESRVAEGYEDASVSVPSQFRAREIVLRLRHPEGKPITRVELDGASWSEFKGNEGWVSFPAASGTRRLRAYY